ncbi:NupC/NupG family nucleoside CNT transporter [Nocardia sp. ET3-3]|uniref:NupC/NupG family nucleoside CNT transporter n=1 Tax=Nocardia terrae TaxID=2675851 RepID=A0A7K1UUR4_9NOCA|nr:NupC/NupG family nucleoside CNT transporter [Nocardia terrae]
MHYAVGIAGLAVFLLSAWLPSTDRGAALQKSGRIVVLLGLQFLLGTVLLKTSAGTALVRGIRDGFDHILGYAAQGTAFVFGDLVKVGESPALFFSVMMPIVFVSVLIGILQHLRVLPLVIKAVGAVLSKVSGYGRVESFNAVAAVILGQSEVFISLRAILDRIPPQRMYTLAASAMSTVSASILGAYMQLIDARYVIAGIVLNLVGVFVVTSLINPYSVTPEEDRALLDADIADSRKHESFFEMLADYILVGFRVAITVAAMLIGFIALLAMVNGVFAALFHGTTFQDVIGRLFAPLAWLTGVPWDECAAAGRFMGTKLVSNEIVAMQQLRGDPDGLSQRSLAIVSTYLVSFANLASIAIISGALRGLSEKQGLLAARYGTRLLYAATLVSLLSATIVGLLF